MTEYLLVDADGVAVARAAFEAGQAPEDLFHPELAARYHARGAADLGWRWDGAAFVPPAPPRPAELLAYAAARRFAVETGGLVIGGTPFATDDRAKTMLLGARAAAQADPAFVTTWFAADGTTHELGAADLVAISTAVLGHVSACFATYAQVAAGIQASPPTVATYAAVDTAFAALA
ncbi:hypothetical protein OPKNFCMD_3825 [Methylobacterium crusticola]|uniref:DUF4376 domain-containing protein n=1 Tax=Methylobacterium crusticola TaxID=1697972 RepID=A0ABQ4R0W8_9HYPH|nr:DUF4376 domain-containing protein [Methylobacterium crusticola]GJD51074.1 hypothetical protein OPKNFCMD_3825 [Methylobacterium crusticola]